MAFTIYQDPEPFDRHGLLVNQDIDKENDVSKENFAPTVASNILQCNKMLNKKLLENRNLDTSFAHRRKASSRNARVPLSSMSIILYPGFLELPNVNLPRTGANGSTGSVNTNSTNGRLNKVKTLYLPKKSSPLKSLVGYDNEHNLITPLKDNILIPSEYAKKHHNGESIFNSPSVSPSKSRITHKLMALASDKETFSSSSFETRNSTKSSIDKVSSLSIPGLASLSSESTKQRIFKDKPLNSTANSSPSSVISEDFIMDQVSDSPSVKSMENVDALPKFSKLHELWVEPNNSFELDSSEKRQISNFVQKSIPTYITPPRQINTKILVRMAQNEKVNKQSDLRKVSSASKLSKSLQNRSMNDFLVDKFVNSRVNVDRDDVEYGQGISDGFGGERNEVGFVNQKTMANKLHFKIFAD